jgi:hypothetical protein
LQANEEDIMGKDKVQGEGNYDADRRYRRGVSETLSETTEKERARAARSMTEAEKKAAEQAEKEGQRKARMK